MHYLQNLQKVKMKLFAITILLSYGTINCLFVKATDKQNTNTSNNTFPVIVITWDYKEATEKGTYITIVIYKEKFNI